MPKIVDHNKRKIQIAEATWKVIIEEGIEQATMRKIAQASGLSVGAIRHYFSSQSELLAFSMELVSERVLERMKMRKHTNEDNPLDVVTEGICEVLPVDEERTIEMEVWLAFSSKVLVDTALRERSNAVYQDMHRGLKKAIYMLQSSNLTKDDIDIELEANRLHALVDGMATHHLLNTEYFTRQQMMDTLNYHLQSLCK